MPGDDNRAARGNETASGGNIETDGDSDGAAAQEDGIFFSSLVLAEFVSITRVQSAKFPRLFRRAFSSRRFVGQNNKRRDGTKKFDDREKVC